MCGIVGTFARQKNSQPQAEKLRRMRDAIAYRGPDQAGEYIKGPIALGNRRLSIIDLSTGDQPLHSSDGRYTIVFNGEIYNYRQLRQPLEKHYPFKTTSDTEVLLYHYIHFGPEGLSQLNGMFAFAIWDEKTHELFLARDRFGKKPLYYHETPSGEFLFASEVKSIVSYLPQKPPLNQRSLVQYLLYEYIPDLDTAFTGIHKLAPGSWMKISPTTMTHQQWWHIFPIPQDYTGDFSHPEKTFDTLLDNAVQARMVADVPVGVLLSGGIDSSTVAWYMRQHTQELHSFSIGFPDASFDESAYARLAAEKFNIHHHAIPFTLDTFHETLATIQERLDEPLADASLLPTYAVSKEAKKWVTVVLDGDGADELLYGYDTFPAYYLSLLYDKIPTVIHHGLQRLIDLLPTRHTYFSLDFRLKSFLRGVQFSDDIRNQVWIGSFHDKELHDLLTPEWQPHITDIYKPVTDLTSRLHGLSPLERLSIVYLSHYLQGNILPKIDRATMYASLEARTPFLDPTLVSFVLQLPLEQKYTFFQGKKILRQVMANRIPQEILKRKKQGFGIPLGAWLKGPLKDLMLSTLSTKNVQALGMVRPDVVQRYIHEHLSGKADHRKKVWTLMILQWWWERWGR